SKGNLVFEAIGISKYLSNSSVDELSSLLSLSSNIEFFRPRHIFLSFESSKIAIRPVNIGFPNISK
ncbi:11877_t:CDS:2, partial [Racocetra persica]